MRTKTYAQLGRNANEVEYLGWAVVGLSLVFAVGVGVYVNDGDSIAFEVILAVLQIGFPGVALGAILVVLGMLFQCVAKIGKDIEDAVRQR